VVRDGDHHQDQHVGRASESVTRHHAYDSTKGRAGLRRSLSSGRALRGPGGLIHPARGPRGAATTGVCDGRIIQEAVASPAKA